MKTAEEMLQDAKWWTDDLSSICINPTQIASAMELYANQFKQDKPLLGLAKTSELIYELSARCDTGSIDKGGNYRTYDY